MATTSKDGTWKLWKIDVRYHLGEDPKCLLTIPTPFPKKNFNLIAISPDQKTVAITIANILVFYDISGKLLTSIEDAHDASIVAISWSPDSSGVATAGDNTVKIWKKP